ncbi:hypothetical protein DNA98_08835 [Meiothermus sp. Pnk-1]|nr:hypothetical protein DNA98_08835 [Meiothermus sp. Pnk-1]
MAALMGGHHVPRGGLGILQGLGVNPKARPCGKDRKPFRGDPCKNSVGMRAEGAIFSPCSLGQGKGGPVPAKSSCQVRKGTGHVGGNPGKKAVLFRRRRAWGKGYKKGIRAAFQSRGYLVQGFQALTVYSATREGTEGTSLSRAPTLGAVKC